MSRPTRVLHIITGLGTGGAETSLWRLLQSLGPAARHHRVISLMDRGIRGDAIEQTGATVGALGLPRGHWDVGALRRLVAEARAHLPDVIHGWMYHGGLAASATAALVLGRLPVVWGVRHGLDDWRNQAASFKRFHGVMARLSRHPARIVYNSVRSMEQHEARGFNAARGLVIPNGFDAARFCPDAAAGARLRAELGIDPDALVVALVARVDPLKDHVGFIAAASRLSARLPGARFLLVGKGTDSDAAIRDAIVKYGVEGCLYTLGERADVPAIFAAATIATLTSTSEGSPNVVGEAMACGCACVVTDVGDAADLVGDTGVVVRPRDPRALAQAWHQLLTAPDLQERGARARARVLERYALPEVTAHWSRLYEDVRVGRRPNTRGAEARRWLALHGFTVDMSVRFIAGQPSALRQHGIDCEVVSSPGPELDAIARREGVRTHAVPMTRRITPLADLVSLWRLIGIIRQRQPDAVHAHTPKAGLLFTLAAWLCGVGVRTYHVHGLPWQTARGIRRRLLMLSDRIACAAATDIWCVSQSVRRGLVQAGLASPSRAVVLGAGSANGVDAHGAFAPDAVDSRRTAAVRARHEIPADALVVGFIGRLVCDKGLRELVEAWPQVRAACPAAHLLVVGPEEPHDPLPAGTRDALFQLAGVHVHGVDWDTPRLLGAMDLVVLPTYREGFPVVLLEAAAMGRPVVATRVAGCIDAVDDGVTGALVPAGDASALAAAMIRYLQDPALRSTHGSAARQRVERDYDVGAIHRCIATACSELRLRAESGRSDGDLVARAIKRGADVAMASIAMIALLPVCLLTAVAVRWALGSPVLFRQVRPGLRGRPFTLFKFRTMRNAFDRQGLSLNDAERLTPFGRWLRSTSIDELPELWNVLRGDMSLVGPRPLLMQYLPLYSTEQERRHTMRPGITGWAQVQGRNALPWAERFRLDVWYVDHWSLGLDLRILVNTVVTVLGRRGVAAPGEATVTCFPGSAANTAMMTDVG